MTPERHARAKAIFDATYGLSPEARAAYLDQACGSDHELRREVESLLIAHDRATTPSARRPTPANGRSARDASGVDAKTRELLTNALDGRYEIVRLKGSGGMGAVYLARDIALDLDVAIKVLRSELTRVESSRQRFRREAQIAANLKHPNIVWLREYREVDDVWCFVMDHVPGRALNERIEAEGAMLHDEVRSVLLDLAGALEYAHRHKVIHRDIKPANILFDADHHALLADFGIAKIAGTDTLTPKNAVIGTPCYMSPEQMDGRQDVDHRTDIYSLGLVAYAMLSGRQPYADLSLEEIRRQKWNEQLTPIRTLAPSVPQGLADVITKCLAADRARRFADAEELRHALEHAGRQPVPLPEPWMIMPGFGQWSLVWSTCWTAYALLGDHRPRELFLILIVAALVPLGFVLQIWNVGRHGVGWLPLIRMAYWPPEWWGMWWPAPLRRPADLWMRLPWPARAVRIMLSIFLVGMPALVIVQSRLAAPAASLVVAEYVLLAATFLATVAGVAWTRSRGVPTGEAARLLFGATMPTPAWRTPSVAPLLSPARGVRPPIADDPHDHCRAISEMAELLPSVFREDGRRAVDLAKHLLREVKRYNAKIVAVDGMASLGEVERLMMQLAGLGPPTSGESDGKRALRDAVEHQITILRAMRREAEGAAYARTTMVDFMRSLWARVRRVHEDASMDAVDPAPAAADLRALCGEIERHLAEGEDDPEGADDRVDPNAPDEPPGNGGRPAPVPPKGPSSAGFARDGGNGAALETHGPL